VIGQELELILCIRRSTNFDITSKIARTSSRIAVHLLDTNVLARRSARTA